MTRQLLRLQACLFLFFLAISSYAATGVRVEAESFDNASGARAESNGSLSGGGNVGYVTNGTWIMFSGFEFDGAEEGIEIAGAGSNGGNVELRLGSETGTLIGTVAITPTSGWGEYVTNQANITAQSAGMQDLYLVFTGGDGYLFNLDYFSFTGNITTHTLAVSLSNEAAGSVIQSPSGSEIPENAEVTLTAEENIGYSFSHWEDAQGNHLSTSNPYQFTMTSAMDIVASYAAVETFTLNLNVSGGANDYMVTASPEGLNGKYNAGTVVTLSAIGNNIMTFTNWSTGETSSELQVTMDGHKDLTAEFSPAEFIVGWDFFESGSGGRAADFYSKPDNETSSFVLRKADGSSVGWLDKSMENGGYSGKGAAAKWTAISGSNSDDSYYYEISFDASDFTDIHIESYIYYQYHTFLTHKMEYSIDGVNFTELASHTFDAGGTDYKAWIPMTSTLGSDANNASKVYIRWIPDWTSGSVGGGTQTQDHLAIAEVFVTGKETVVDDGVAPVLTSSVPTDGTANASATGKIVLNFDERVKVPEGATASLGNNTLPALVTGKSVTFAYSGLEYNTAYTFTLAGGTVSDLTDNAITDPITINFTTLDRPTVAKKAYDFIVGVDGDVKAAFDAAKATSGSGNRFVIFFPDGEYDLGNTTGDSKQQTFFNVPNVSLIGQSMDGTILFNEPDAADEGIGNTPTLNFEGQTSNIYMQDLTLLNKMDFRKGVFSGRAVALREQGDRYIYKNVKLLSNQDTYFTGSGRTYWEGGAIHGTVDFIFGGGDIFFNETLIYLEDRGGNHVTAAATSSDWGYVFSNCTIDGFASTDGNYKLGRPWQNSPKVAFINTTMKVLPTTEGWSEWGALPARYTEYNSVTASGTALDLSGRKKTYCSNGDCGNSVTLNPVLTQAEAAEFTVENVLSGADTWQPKLLTEQAPVPNITLTDNTISWDDSEYVLGWAVIKDGKFQTFVTTNSYEIPADTHGQFTVRAANAAGGLSPASNKVSIFGEVENVLAFPGAEGYGKFATGGRGAKVVEVTNLNDSGVGSFRYALQNTSGARTIVFRVGGIIELKSQLTLRNAKNVTIAGQTAPGDGICIKNFPLMIENSQDIIVRFIRSRLGDELSTGEDDAVSVRNSTNVIIDHCSLSWSIDSILDVTHNSGKVTVQYCILSEAMNESVHTKGSHGYAAGWDGFGGATYHHNLIAHCVSRTPRLDKFLNSDNSRDLIEIYNNVIFNWAGFGAYGGEKADINWQNNFYKYGPETTGNMRYWIFGAGDEVKMHVDGNHVYGYPNVTEDNSLGINYDGKSLEQIRADVLVDQPFETMGIELETALDAYKTVLAQAGTSLPKRDAVDERVIKDVIEGTGGFIDSQSEVGGWPVYNGGDAPADSDHDGMPDTWETTNGLNPNDNTDGAQVFHSEGYTALEVYLNSLVVLNDGGTIEEPPTPVFEIEITSELESDTIFMNQGKVQFEAVVTPYDATNKTLKWSVSDETILAIDSLTGEVTPLAPGRVFIFANSTDGSGIRGTKVIRVESALGIDDQGFMVYPNPTTGIINLRFNDGTTITEVYDLSGTKRKEFTGNRIDISDLTDGMYLLKVKAGKGTQNIKIIKK